MSSLDQSRDFGRESRRPDYRRPVAINPRKRSVPAVVVAFGLVLAAAWLFNVVPVVSAEAKSAKITQLETTLLVSQDGSIDVTEKTTWKFSGGDFSRIRRPLQLNPGQSLVSYSIGEQTESGFVAYTPGEFGTRTPGTYAVSGGGTAYEIEIYFSAASGDVRTFVISYVVSGAVIAYQDVADLKWTWVGKENSAPIDRLAVRAEIPQPGAAEEFRVWGHGPLSGKVTKLSNTEAKWEARSIPPQTLVDGRIVFPSSLVPSVTRLQGNGLDRILAEEKEAADQVNLQRRLAQARQAGGIALVIGSAVLWIFLFLRFGREYRPRSQPVYERDIPSRLPPAIVGYLWNMGGVQPKEVTATLMDCVRRGFLRIEPGGLYDPGIFQRERNDYRFVWTGTPKDPQDQLRPYENRLVALLLSASPQTPGVSTQSAFERMAKSHPARMREFFRSSPRKSKRRGSPPGL